MPTEDKKINKGEVQDYNGKNVYIYSNAGSTYIEDATTGKILYKNTNGTKQDYTQDGKVIYQTKNNNVFELPLAPSDYDLTKYEGAYNKDVQKFNELLDSNPDLQKAIYEKYKSNPGADKSLSQPEVIALLKKGNYDNSIVQSVYKDNPFLQDEQWDALYGEDKNIVYKETLKSLGLVPMEDKQIKPFQSVYQAATDVAKDDKWNPLFKNSGFDINPVGKNDETYRGINVSPVDDFYGNTTVGQMFKLAAPVVKEPPVVKTPDPSVDPDPFAVTEVKPGEDIPKAKPLLDTWFAPDIMNFTGAITDPINRYEPAQGKVDLITPGYDLLDPTRQLAANQEQMARYQNMLENSVDPQIALSASLAASGEGFQNAANVLANVENANVGIVNQAYAQNAGIENSEIMANENARQKYIAEMAMLNENTDKAKSLKKWRVIGAFNQGWHNFNKDQMMEQVLFPQVHTDNITGAVQFSENGRDFMNPDTYSPAYGTGTASITPEYWGRLYQQVDQELTDIEPDPTKRAKMTDDYMKTVSNKMLFKQGFDPNAFAQMNMKYGGHFNINDYIGI